MKYSTYNNVQNIPKILYWIGVIIMYYYIWVGIMLLTTEKHICTNIYQKPFSEINEYGDTLTSGIKYFTNIRYENEDYAILHHKVELKKKDFEKINSDGTMLIYQKDTPIVCVVFFLFSVMGLLVIISIYHKIFSHEV